MAKSTHSKQEKVNLDEVIGRNIRSERQARNLSRDELAEMLELTTSHMGLIERGERGATAVTLAKLTKVLQLPIDNLFSSPVTAVAMREDSSSSRIANQKKITSLTANLTDAELTFVVQVIQGIVKMNAANKEEE